MTSTATIGPWWPAESSESETVYYIYGSGDLLSTRIATVSGIDAEVVRKRARLLAAAPDLLTALRDLVTEIRAYASPECDDEGEIGAAELKAADAAIAKAEALL